MGKSDWKLIANSAINRLKFDFLDFFFTWVFISNTLTLNLYPLSRKKPNKTFFFFKYTFLFNDMYNEQMKYKEDEQSFKFYHPQYLQY